MDKYKYKPSSHILEGSKYYNLTQRYTPYIEQFIKGNLDNDNKEELFKGLTLISNYIYNGFFFFIKESTDKKLNYEKIIISIYYRLLSLGDTYVDINSDIKDLSEKAVFLSIGIESFNKKNFLWINNESLYDNFIKHTTEKVFKPLLFEYLKEKSTMLDSVTLESTLVVEDPLATEELTATDIINKSGLSDMIPLNIKDLIIDYLDNGTISSLEKIKPYLTKIYNEMNYLEDI